MAEGATKNTPFTRRIGVFYRPMVSRSAQEPHRVSTTLELLFDLCFVVAVGQTAAGLHHAISENHIGHGVLSFLLVFWAIWWAWFQFSWFATSYDTDDVPYRLAVLVQIAGGLVIAAGVPRAFEGDFGVIVIGYVLMRLAGVSQWLRAAKSDPERRPTALRYAIGIVIVQIAWIARLALPEHLLLVGFLVLLLAELAVPVWAERASGTIWNAHHIAERYGLFTIIVLGETVVGATSAIQDGSETGQGIGTLIPLAVAGLIIVFSLWWLYFDQSVHERLNSFRRAFVWGYGHYVIFTSAAAVGAGMEIAVDHALHPEVLAALPAGMAITIPVASYLLFVWLLHIGPRNDCRPIAIAFPTAVVAILAVSFLPASSFPAPIYLTAIITVLLVAVTVIFARERENTVTAVSP
jgi:low temperature requirement protein LtrA